MSELLTSKKKIEKGVWGYRGYVITKNESATNDKIWVITESPESKKPLNDNGMRVIKEICLFVDTENGELTESEKPQPKAKKAKTASASKRKPKDHTEKAVMLDKCGLIFAQIKAEMNIFPPIRKTRGNTVKYIWNDFVRTKAIELDREIPSKDELQANFITLVERIQVKYRDYKLSFDGETLSITYIE